MININAILIFKILCQNLIQFNIVYNENMDSVLSDILSNCKNLFLKKKIKFFLPYSLPRINLTRKMRRKIAPIVTLITGIA